MKNILRPVLASILTTMVLGMVATASSASIVFDNVTAAENGVPGAYFAVSSAPNSFMGGGYVLAAGTTAITGIEVFFFNPISAQNWTNLAVNIYVWDAVNTGAVNAATPAFSNLLGFYEKYVSAVDLPKGYYFSFFEDQGTSDSGSSFLIPLALTDTTIGLSVIFGGSTDGGQTYRAYRDLTSLISYGIAPTVGPEVFDGFYRNSSSEFDGNFITRAVRFPGLTNQSLAVRIYGDVAIQEVPEPGSLFLVGLGLAGLAATRKRKQVR